MKTHQQKMNHIAHNIANVNTIGYKKQSVQFSELLHNTVNEQDARISENAGELSNGMGVRLAESKAAYTQGSLTNTGDPLHLAVGGNGFFGVRDDNNELLLTRDGAFHLNSQNEVVNDQGYLLEMNGQVLDGQTPSTDQIPLFLPTDSSGLTPSGGNLYRINEGAALLNSATNPEAFGEILSGHIEESTVDLAQSFTDMIMSQRAYSLNAKVTQSTDEIYSLINQFT